MSCYATFFHGYAAGRLGRGEMRKRVKRSGNACICLIVVFVGWSSENMVAEREREGAWGWVVGERGISWVIFRVLGLESCVSF